MTDVNVRDAVERLKGRVRRTPLLPLTHPDLGAVRVLVKPESLQLTGSFKIRGATNFLASLPPVQRRLGVVAHSSGNHAQGVAAAARAYGVQATVVIPEGAPDIKVEGTKALGARVVRCEQTRQARDDAMEEIAVETGATRLPPYDHARVIEGQGTVGWEIAEDLPDVANVLVPIGGGGLASGVCLALKELAPEAQVIGVEPALAADAQESLRVGERVTWPAERTNATMADGVRSQVIGELNFAVLKDHLTGVVAVPEEAIAAAVRHHALSTKLVVEPTGAITLAALLRLAREGSADGVTLAPGPTVIVASGGNVEPAQLARLLTA